MASLSTKVTIPIVLISTFSIVLTAFLNLGKFDRTLGELDSSRARYVLSGIQSTLETGLALGLPLRGIANAQAALDFEVKKDSSIVSISVYDEHGRIAFHSGALLSSDPNTLPAAWKQYVSASSSKAWHLEGKDEDVVASGLVSAIGTSVGGVALRYSRKEHNTTVDSVASYLLRSASVGIVLTAAVSMLLTGYLVRKTSAKLKSIERTLDSALPLDGGDPSPQGDLLALSAGVIESSLSAIRDLRDSHELLDRRDEEEARS